MTTPRGEAPFSPAPKKSGIAIAALIAGIVAFLTGIIPIVGAVLGIGAVALGVFTLIKKQKKGFGITAMILGGLAMISSIAVTAGITATLPNAAPEPKPVGTTQVVTGEPSEEPTVMVVVPDVAGQTAVDAIVTLTAAGLTPPSTSTIEDSTAKVLATDPAAGTEIEEGTAVTFTLEEKPKLTVGQQNAVDLAQSYLDYSGFSRTRLIDQLVYEGFSTEDATFGADNAGADWNTECAESAKSYMDYSSFSRQGLADQLAYEGFQQSEIDFGLAAVGY